MSSFPVPVLLSIRTVESVGATRSTAPRIAHSPGVQPAMPANRSGQNCWLESSISRNSISAPAAGTESPRQNSGRHWRESKKGPDAVLVPLHVQHGRPEVWGATEWHFRLGVECRRANPSFMAPFLSNSECPSHTQYFALQLPLRSRGLVADAASIVAGTFDPFAPRHRPCRLWHLLRRMMALLEFGRGEMLPAVEPCVDGPLTGTDQRQSHTQHR